MADLSKIIAALNEAAEHASVTERLVHARASLPGRILFTTSFGMEDQWLTALIAEAALDIGLATLDTGRLFPQTHALWAETEAKYGVRVRAAHPTHAALEGLIVRDGINGFYESVDKRKACCAVRKVEPLRRLLAGASGWITGLRAGQSPARDALSFAAFDDLHGLVKINPLYDVSRETVAAEVRRLDIPHSPLHDAGYASIGCAPCTRAIRPGEPERAGRWWWEDEALKECGLHVGADGRLARAGASPRMEAV